MSLGVWEGSTPNLLALGAAPWEGTVCGRILFLVSKPGDDRTHISVFAEMSSTGIIREVGTIVYYFVEYNPVRCQ